MSRLNNFQEIVGTLSDVITKNDKIKVIFSTTKEIYIPEGAIPLGKLKNVVGKRVGIFNCDGIYKIRIIRER